MERHTMVDLRVDMGDPSLVPGTTKTLRDVLYVERKVIGSVIALTGDQPSRKTRRM